MNDLSHSAIDAASVGLTHLSLLRVHGADARTFLDSQLTRNVPAAEGLASRDIAAAIAKRLRMYVLRAKATIEESTSFIGGVVGTTEVPTAAAALPVWGVHRADESTFVRYPDVGGRPRWLVVAPTPASNTVDAETWRRLDIESGLAMITAPIQDRFVPQMLNLEALGGVDFKKGCYPGQEIVARSHYLGKLKRRMTLASTEATDVPSPGTDVWSSGANEASGMVVSAERGVDRGAVLLVELPVALFASDALRVGAVDGPTLTIEPLPYVLPDNEVFVRPKL